MQEMNFSPVSTLQDIKRTVLVVDDESVNREILGSILENTYHVMYAADGIEAFETLSHYPHTISVILLDLIMPRMNGQAVIKQMMADETLRKIPIIVLTADRQAEVESLNLGASDFITKPYDAPEVILARVKRVIELYEDRTVIQAIEHDPLTKLLNKDFFCEYSAITSYYYQDEKMDALFLNVDHFHLVNEIYGRATGDQVLQAIAEVIYDYANQNGGIAAKGDADTFLIYVKRQQEYETLHERIMNRIKKISENMHIRIRIGVYEKLEEDGDNMSVMFDRAKLACDNIRGNFQFFIAYYDSDLQQGEVFQEHLINDIYDAIEQQQFVVYYQPKYDIKQDTPVLKSAEALVRWNHPEYGMIPPAKFISLFEQNGLIQKVDHYVWRQVASQLRQWKEKFKNTVPISVNMSRIDMLDDNIVGRFQDLISEFGLDPADLHLEITESAYSDNADRLIEVVNSLRDKGFIIEMDDFGAGYSSLNMLTTIPIDVLKMDMKFVHNMQQDAKRQKMIELVMEIADFLSVPVIAEGVEDETQYEFLKEVGCDLIQGYYFSRPITAEDFENLLVGLNE